jgi:hypothetical protein
MGSTELQYFRLECCSDEFLAPSKQNKDGQF